jgi:hypothetical protein
MPIFNLYRQTCFFRPALRAVFFFLPTGFVHLYSFCVRYYATLSVVISSMCDITKS